MAFELSVQSPNAFPKDLKTKWEAWLAKLDVEVEIHPSFDPASWTGGFLPMKVSKISDSLIGTPLRPPALSGFEVYFNRNTANFRSAMGRTSTEFALLCLCAAGLANAVEGSLIDPQAGTSISASEALTHVQSEINQFVKSARSRDLRQYPFSEWK
jgi:hypothetical protein